MGLAATRTHAGLLLAENPETVLAEWYRALLHSSPPLRPRRVRVRIRRGLRHVRPAESPERIIAAACPRTQCAPERPIRRTIPTHASVLRDHIPHEQPDPVPVDNLLTSVANRSPASGSVS
jgi:hypothetical protein